MEIKSEEARKAKCIVFDKNLFVLCSGWMMLYSSFSSLKDISSSVNHQHGVGLLSLTCFYVGYMTSCIFTMHILDIFNCKTSIFLSSLFHIPFVISFAFPTFYISAPLSFLGGCAQALLWTSSNSYLVGIARYGSLSINVVFSIFYSVASLAPFVGGLSAMFVFSVCNLSNLSVYTSPGNVTNHTDLNNTLDNSSINNTSPTCGSEFCYNADLHLHHLQLNSLQLYAVVGFFSLLMLLATLMFLIFLDSNYSKFMFVNGRKSCFFTGLLDILQDRTFLGILLLILYFGYHLSFFSGSFLQV